MSAPGDARSTDRRGLTGPAFLLLSLAVSGGVVWGLTGDDAKHAPRAAPSGSSAMSAMASGSASTGSAHVAFSIAAPTGLDATAAPRVDPRSQTPPPKPAEAHDCPPGTVYQGDENVHGESGLGCGEVDAKGNVTREGPWTVHLEDGRTAVGRYVDGAEDGQWAWWYPNGVKAMELELDHGRPNGRQVEWLPSGERFAERTYKDGALDGPITLTYPNGGVVHEEWKHGVRVFPAPEAPPGASAFFPSASASH